MRYGLPHSVSRRDFLLSRNWWRQCLIFWRGSRILDDFVGSIRNPVKTKSTYDIDCMTSIGHSWCVNKTWKASFVVSQSFGITSFLGQQSDFQPTQATTRSMAPAPTTLPSPAPIAPSTHPSVFVEWVHIEDGINGEAGLRVVLVFCQMSSNGAE